MGWPISIKLPQKTLKTLPASLPHKALCFDIDDTFSTDGKITAEAFTALWKLKKAGKILVPVTGRPAGWCDHIARFWPVDAVIGENGAFAMWMDDGKLQRSESPGAIPTVERKKKLEGLRSALLKRWPDIRFASDQAYRAHDLAIDICEDVKPWSALETTELLELCKSQGAHAKLSSIHVNAWFGDFDKASGFKHWLSLAPTAIAKIKPSQWLYVGDSPNDEPLFAAFAKSGGQSVGVANIKPFLAALACAPTWITTDRSGRGFVQLARALLAGR